MNGIMTIPPKSLAALVDRARRMDGCIRLENSDIYKFVMGNTVATVIGPLNIAIGHQERSPLEATEIRARLLNVASS